jgi:hypothetical protein
MANTCTEKKLGEPGSTVCIEPLHAPTCGARAEASYKGAATGVVTAPVRAGLMWGQGLAHSLLLPRAIVLFRNEHESR